ncbi:MAG TPA: alpha-amylase family glycosyl hydrolase [Candidatus Limnocylindria bacterium]|nr:alpha-amylase family glycosyl hydrolase [Candidatus Limnocylindria bacterium]
MRFVLAAIVVVASVAPGRPSQATVVDWRDEAIYMVMTDRFRNGDPRNDGDSIPGKADWWQGGDLQGVIDELDYIKELGMTAIWITPFAVQTNGGYHGYWPLDDHDVDPHLGTVGKLRQLVDAAHARGLKVIFDVVLNHVGYGHPWLSDPRRAGYFHPHCPINFADQKSVESCWLAGLPDLDTENPTVRDVLRETWAYWTTTSGVDGLRVDAARHLPKDFLRLWTAQIKSARPIWILGEVYSSGYRYQSGFLEAGFDAVTDFQTYDSVRIGLDPRGDLSQLLLPPTLAQDLGAGNADRRAIFIDNHDVPRFVGRDAPDAVGKARLAQALVYLFTMPGTPILYYGTEVALPGGPDPDDRRPMPWTGGDETIRQLVRDLATLRQATPSLRRGAFADVRGERGLAVYARSGPAGDVAVVSINGDEQRSVDVPLAKLGLSGAVLHRAIGPGASGSVRGQSLSLTLAPRAAAVFLLGAVPADEPPWAILALVTLALGALGVLAYRRVRMRPSSGASATR